jgi:hypothetical protein
MQRGVSRQALVLLAAALALGAGMLSVEPAGAAESMKMQALLNADGSGFLGVNTPKEPILAEEG